MRFGRLVGGSQAMRALHAEIERAARADRLVLVTGESGTGKELVAREIHARGPRPEEPFLTQGCAALADAQLESDLFGHRRGAFPGATMDRRGLFAMAGRGTVFLDEVGDLSPPLQGTLLRVLQEGAVRPLGADAAQPIACRVIAATRHDLRALVEQKKFREDLYYRLDVLRITVPPLRLRLDDVPSLLEHFLYAHKRGPLEVTDKALELLLSYAWPGNVRELENEARRLAALGEPKLTARHISPDIAQGKGLARAGGSYSGKTLADVEKEMVVAALRETGGNKARAARQLGIPKTTLYHLLERYELK
jgi:transcriptional regulator with PAS, ATPase and Fis domain